MVTHEASRRAQNPPDAPPSLQPPGREPVVFPIERCRSLIDCGYTLPDEQIELVRGQLYVLANAVLDCLPARTPGLLYRGRNSRSGQLRLVEAEEQSEERAAILEFDGDMNRDYAELEATRGELGRQIRSRVPRFT